MRVIAGPEKKTRVMGEKERLITAYHEMGHAIVGHFLEHTDPVHKISIISRGQALGYTISLPTEDKFLTTRAELTDTMAMTLGGRAAEEIVFGEITTGASNDLEKVTATAKQMVMRFGMSEKLGPRVFGHDHGQPFLGREFSAEPDYSDEIAREIDDEIRRIVEEAHQRRARTSSSEHREQLDDDLRDPAQPRDDRARAVHRPARRQVGGRGLRPRGARAARPPEPPEPEPKRKPAEGPRPLPRPGLAAEMRADAVEAAEDLARRSGGCAADIPFPGRRLRRGSSWNRQHRRRLPTRPGAAEGSRTGARQGPDRIELACIHKNARAGAGVWTADASSSAGVCGVRARSSRRRSRGLDRPAPPPAAAEPVKTSSCKDVATSRTFGRVALGCRASM